MTTWTIPAGHRCACRQVGWLQGPWQQWCPGSWAGRCRWNGPWGGIGALHQPVPPCKPTSLARAHTSVHTRTSSASSPTTPAKKPRRLQHPTPGSCSRSVLRVQHVPHSGKAAELSSSEISSPTAPLVCQVTETQAGPWRGGGMLFSALPPPSTLWGKRPLVPKLGKLVTTGVTGRWPSRDTSMSRVVSSRDTCRAKCPGGAGQVTCSLGPSASPPRGTGICAPQATLGDTAPALEHCSGGEMRGDKVLTCCQQGRCFW